MDNITKRALVYCRVSTKEQVDEGNSLITQEKACRDYADRYGFEIAEVFIEQGESAKTIDRTELQRLLAYVTNKKNKIDAVIIYKIDRLSRNVNDYGQIRLIFKRYGVDIKSVTEQFEDDPMGRFVENLMAGVAQLDNEVRAERCTGGMKEAVREGRYVWSAPVGYINSTVNGKPNLAPSSKAHLIKELFELIAVGIYSLEEVRRIINEKGLRSGKGKPITKQYFHKLVKNKVYMGIIEKFGECNKGVYEPLISEELYKEVQAVLKRRGKKMNSYKTDNPDFPLRRFVLHPNGLKLTGSWSKGRSGKYPFYRFGIKGTNYQRDGLEKMFKEYMDSYRVEEKHIKKLKSKVRDKFYKATAKKQQEVPKMAARLEEVRDKQSTLIDKNLKGYISDQVLKVQMDRLEQEEFQIMSFLSKASEGDINVLEALEFAEEYLMTPSSVWVKVDPLAKLKLQWFQFPQGVTFDGEEFGTAEVALIFNVKGQLLADQSILVDPSGLEPLTS